MIRVLQSVYLVDNINEIVDFKDFKHWCKYSKPDNFEKVEEVLKNNRSEIEKLKGNKQVNVRLPYDVATILDEKFQRLKTVAILTAYVLDKQ